MRLPPGRTLALAVAAATLPASAALAVSVRLTPVKGATYTGTVHDETISVKVARNGKSATLSLPAAPGFCQGGAAPEAHSAKPATISKDGALTGSITFMSGGIHPQKLATVAVKGHFLTVGSTKPVFDGTVKSTFALAGTTSCDGQESFQAVKR